MTGVYPDVPSKRLAYDRDGSACAYYISTAVTTVNQAMRQAMNSELAASGSPTVNANGAFWSVIFPVATTIMGYYMHCGGGGASIIGEYSLDTTTGLDGTWTQFRASHGTPTAGYSPAYRTSIFTTGLNISMKGIRWRQNGAGNWNINILHLYGYRTAASNRLELWHPTLDQPLYSTPALGDHGDVPRAAGNQDFSFRIKNLSATLTASTITITPQELSPGSPSVLSLTTLNYNGGAFGSAGAAISGPASLAPGAISDVVIVRTNVTALAPIGPWTPRVVAAAATWA